MSSRRRSIRGWPSMRGCLRRRRRHTSRGRRARATRVAMAAARTRLPMTAPVCACVAGQAVEQLHIGQQTRRRAQREACRPRPSHRRHARAAPAHRARSGISRAAASRAGAPWLHHAGESAAVAARWPVLSDREARVRLLEGGAHAVSDIQSLARPSYCNSNSRNSSTYSNDMYDVMQLQEVTRGGLSCI